MKQEQQKQDETGVYLWVTGYGEDAAVVTDLIGLEPTRISVPGQPLSPIGKALSRTHKWRLDSSLPASAHIDDHFEALLQVLEPHAKAIKSATERFQAGINSYVYYYVDWTPGIHLSERVIQLMAAMNLSADFDLYFLGSDDSKK